MNHTMDQMDVEQAFSFYNLDEAYKERCYACIERIKGSALYREAFQNVYERIYCGEFRDIKKLWSVTDPEGLFAPGIDPFCTNVMILAGHRLHEENIEKMNLDNTQVAAHKKRVKECFENDLKERGYPAIRVNQMLWAVHFIRTRIIEAGILQYEYTAADDGKTVIKIHIPKDNRLDIAAVKKSLADSEAQIKKAFGVRDFIYKCSSWLISSGIYEIVGKDSNIGKFHDLFSVQDGKDCVDSILNFVFQDENCRDYTLLPENTSLQRKIKAQLLQGNTFYTGIGTLK